MCKLACIQNNDDEAVYARAMSRAGVLARTFGECRDIARSAIANAATSTIAKQSEMPAWLNLKVGGVKAMRKEWEQSLQTLMQRKDYKPMKLKELCYLLEITGDERDEFLQYLTDSVNSGRLVRTKHDRYLLPPKDVLTGEFNGSRKGFGFVRVPGYDEDFFIPEHAVNGAFQGDTVMIRLNPVNRGPKTEAEVIKILSRGITTVTGTYRVSDGIGFVTSGNRKLGTDLYIPSDKNMKAVDGNIVVAEIEKYDPKGASPEGRIIEIIGHIDDPKDDILMVVRAFNLPETFPEDVMEQLRNIPDKVSEAELEGRKDFRSLETVTIDGETAKDFDDAITLSEEDGIYHLGVHIADVTNYVTEGSPLDEEALRRGTSVYLADTVIPMLPHQLSNGICSLNPDVDRLTLSCLMDIDPTGKILSHEICEGVIHSNARMTYTDVNKLITDADDAPVEKYNELIPFFKRMAKLSDIIRTAREARGSIDFDIEETEIVVGEDGKPSDIRSYERNAATKLIEDFMLAANETVAEDVFWQEIPFEYRVHEAPDDRKVEALSFMLRNFKLYLHGGRDAIHPREFQRILKEIEGKPYEAMISRLTLRTMQRARYGTVCAGHFGLATKYYCHFTSPIRRYPDLQIHRILKENLHGQLTDARIRHYEDILPAVAADNSAKERRADEAERDVDKLKQIEYMEERLGEVYNGIISGFNHQSIFVELPNTVEGVIPLGSLSDDFYEYHEEAFEMIGSRTKKTYKLGDPVTIQVVKTEKAERRILFRFYTEDMSNEEKRTKTDSE